MAKNDSSSLIWLLIGAAILVLIAIVAAGTEIQSKAIADFPKIFGKPGRNAKECEAAKPDALAKITELERRVEVAVDNQEIREARGELAHVKAVADCACGIIAPESTNPEPVP